MPTSASPSRRIKPQSAQVGRRSYWPLIPIGVLIAAGAILAALPASVITRFLPRDVRAEQLSGTVWHGVAGKLAVDGQDAGAIEWRLHPFRLLRGALAVDLRWVDLGVSIDAVASIDRAGLRASAVRGGGPIDALRNFGVPRGWHGTADIALSTLTMSFSRLEAIVGDVKFSNVASAEIAGGANLGGYLVRFGAGAGAGDVLAAHVEDTGGPLRLRATISVDQTKRRGTLSGTLAARPFAPRELQAAVADLAQARGLDAAGRVPVDLEFTF